MGAPVVFTAALTKRFGEVRALEGLDLEVGPGEVLGYLGPNGAGKTTTLRLLLDFLRPTSGECKLFGGDGADPAVRARVGYLPGELRIDPTYTAGDVIDYFGSLRGREDRGRARELLQRFDLDPARRYRDLSTGNRRKVGIVQAFMHRPDLLLLDEPTSGLDPLLQAEFATLVREVNADGAAVLLSSHVVREVEALATDVAILRSGRLVATVDIEELRRRSRQRIQLFVDGAFDAAPFRALPGVVDCTVAGDVVDLVVEGSVDAVVKAAAALRVRRIQTQESDLEAVFLDYYRDDR